MPRPSHLYFAKRRVAVRYPGLIRWLGRLALGGVILPYLGALLFESLGRAYWILAEACRIAFAWGVLGAVILAGVGLVLGSASFPRPSTGSVSVEALGVSIRRSFVVRRFPRGAMQDGLVLPGKEPRVVLQLDRGRTLEIEVASAGEGKRVLRILGLDPAQRRVSVPLGTYRGEVVAGCLGLAVASWLWLMVMLVVSSRSMQGSGIIGWTILVALSTWVVRRAARPIHVVVGSDGVRVLRAFGSEWVPHADIQHVHVDGRRLRLLRRGGDEVEVAASPEVVQAIARRLRAAQRRAAAATPRGAEILERRGRDPAAWREDLRRATAAAGDYRAAALTQEDLLAALEDIDAPRDRRVGAALALRIAGHPEAEARIRVAAETSADEGLRAALEEAAQEEIEPRRKEAGPRSSSGGSGAGR